MGVDGGKMVGGLLRGYGRLFASLGLWALMAFSVLAFAAGLVWPLWKLATTWRVAYNLAFAAFIVAGAGLLVAGAFRRRRAAGESAAAILGGWAMSGLRVLAAMAIVVLVWLGYLFFMHPVHAWSLPAGVASVLAVLALSGWLFLWRGKRG